MSIEKKHNEILYILEEEMEHKINNNSVCLRDAAFISYYFIKKGAYEKAKTFIDGNIDKIQTGDVKFNEMVLWLWILGEYLNEIEEDKTSLKYSDVAAFCIDRISIYWCKPRQNWLAIFDKGIYISNIAITYGALQSINNNIKSEKALKLLVSLREYMFNNFLHQGKIVSMLGDKEIYGDISLTAVPFGMLDAGNQILVRSINNIEKELIDKGVRFSGRDIYYGGCTRNDLTCLLSWYYSERGDLARAKWLLEQVKIIWDRDGSLSSIDTASSKEKIYYDHFVEANDQEINESYLVYVLYAIANYNISSKSSIGIESNKTINIIHSKDGTGNKYLNENIERIPNHPQKNDNVIIKMVTQPLNTYQTAHIESSVNGIKQKSIEMHVKASSDGEKYWEGDIGSYEFGDRVEYKFIVRTEYTKIISKTYDFTTREWQPIGNVLRYHNDENSVTLYFSPLKGGYKSPCLKITRNSNNTIVISLSSIDSDIVSDINNQSKSDIKLKTNSAQLNIDIEDLILTVSDTLGRNILKSYHLHKERFIELLTDENGKIYKVRYKFLINSSEKFFGMGERYSKIEFRGFSIDNYVYNQYRDQRDRTYMPVPFTISTNGYGLFADTTMYSIFSFGSRLSDMLEVEADIHKKKQSLDIYLFTGEIKCIMQSFQKISGAPKLPPKWSFGPWMSSNNWDSQAEVNKQIELMNKYKIPSTVIVLEQWSDDATFYIFNDSQYKVKKGNDYFRYEDFTFPEWGRWPNPKKLVDDLHKEGLRVLLWQIPVMKYMDGITHTQRDEDEKIMLKKGFHVKNKDGKAYRIPLYEWFKRSLVPDFSNPETKEWWFNKRLYLLKDIGIDGFKTDGGECIYGEDLQFYDGRTGDEARNQYPNDFIGSYHGFLKEHVDDGGITFSRAGYTGAQKYPIHWAGDERSTFDAFKASVRAGLSCSMSGIPFWGWDFGGFHGELPTADLYIRSAQMAAFCPVMQYHAETKAEFNNDRTPWNMAERTGKLIIIDIYKKYADLRMNLLPYIYHQAIETCKTGIPLMRTMFLEYPDEVSCIGLYEQYFFGDSLMVAPILEEGSYRKDIYFPKGKWNNLFTGEMIIGSRYINSRVNIESIPVFIRENSIAALNLSDDYILFSNVGNSVNSYRNLCFVIFVTDRVNYIFEDDMGNKVIINSSREANKLKLHLDSNYRGNYVLIIRDIGVLKSIWLNSKQIFINNIKNLQPSGYCIRNNDLLIKIDGERKMNLLEIVDNNNPPLFKE